MSFENIAIIIISECNLNNGSSVTLSSFFVSNLNSLGYNISKIVIIPSDLKIIVHEIKACNNDYDVTILVSNLSNSIIGQALGKLFNKDLEKYEQIEQFLNEKNIKFNIDEVLLPSGLCIHAGEKYPLLHINRIFIIHEKYTQSILTILKNYLNIYKKPMIFKKTANIHSNGSCTKLDRSKFGNVQLKVTTVDSNILQLEYSSLSLDDLLEFEDYLQKMVLFVSSKYSIGSSVYSDPASQVKNALQIIETCFEKYSPENTMLSFNGGKDCTVLLHLMMTVLEKKYPRYSQKPICLYVQAGQSYGEQDEFINKCQRFFNLEIIKQQTDIKTALKIILRDRPNLKACLMGTRKTDPYSENLSHFQMTDKDYAEIMRVSPILKWNYHQIWDYLLYYKVPYCKLYDMGYTSLGNMDNTSRNVNLLYKDVLDNEEKYLPAYKLLDEHTERIGRIKKVS